MKELIQLVIGGLAYIFLGWLILWKGTFPETKKWIKPLFLPVWPLYTLNYEMQFQRINLDNSKLFGLAKFSHCLICKL